SQTQVFGQFRRRAIGPERRKEAFETLHFGVRLPRAIPKIVVTHEASLPSNFSLRSFIPRCRFTRTDAGVSPVRSAISGPDIPSTRRRTRVSLYASGSFWIVESAASASARRGSCAAQSSESSVVSLDLRW